MKVAITFDDGKQDHYDFAVPILEKYGYRGLFCIVTNNIGKPGYLTWDEDRDMVRRGHEIASHTASHKNLYQLYLDGRLDELRSEILKSKEIIEIEIGIRLRYLAFPWNAHNGKIFKLVRDAGLEPVTPQRSDLGGYPANSMENVGEYLSRLARNGRRSEVLMFHKVVNSGIKGWAPYPDATGIEFEKRIKSIKDYEGVDFQVVKYGEYEWPVIDSHALGTRVMLFCKRILKKFR